MKNKLTIVFLIIAFSSAVFSKEPVQISPSGVEFPQNYRNWRLIGSSHREDNNTLRVILGNHKAVQAAKDGKTNPWPDGAILAKLVWKDAKHPKWETATVPADFVHAEFMHKDDVKYRETGGWGFARWTGPGLKPYGDDGSFVQECYGCHTPMKDNDYVFTKPSPLP
ncbi:MAG: cytochrome P460 family protein [Gammaproteobacteria bacterium]